MNLHIITGGSRGLGQALVKILNRQGDHVAEISRNGKLNSKTAQSFVCDFKTNKNKDELMEKIFSHFESQNYQMITLINNAGMVEPVGYLEQLNEQDIIDSLMVNLAAPMALTAAFIKHLQFFNGRKVLVNVSSGVARHPKETWGPYCAAKAALESLSAVVALENEEQNTTVINYEPGIIDTEMQSVIRGIPKERFPDLERFVEFKNNGDLADPDFVADHLIKLIFKTGLPTKNFFSITDKI
jgi:benzil reductase ((S)-benzoin forming)